jgi:ATP-dependent DNA ligase
LGQSEDWVLGLHLFRSASVKISADDETSQDFGSVNLVMDFWFQGSPDWSSFLWFCEAPAAHADPKAFGRAAKTVPVSFYAFDLLFLDAYDLCQAPLRYRRDLLEAAMDFKEPLYFTEHARRKVRRITGKRASTAEGVMAKDGNTTYLPGRSRQWLKFKCVKEQGFVIAGHTVPRGQRVGFGALLGGYYERGKLDGKLRHPRFLRLRDDKIQDEVTREK